MQVTLQDLSLAALDRLSVDGLALFIDQRERPLRGLAGLCDWRLCGQLSRVLETSFFQGTGGETLLMPTSGRLPATRLFAFGLGPGFEGGLGAEPQIVRAFAVAARAGISSLGLSIDFLGPSLEQGAAAWARAAHRCPVQKQVLFGDWRTNGKAFRAGVAPFADIEIVGDAAVPGQKRA